MPQNNWKEFNPPRRKITEKNSVSSVFFGVENFIFPWLLHKTLLIIVLLGLIGLAFSQVDTAWVRRYNGPENGDDYAYAIAVDGTGNVYVTGFSTGIFTGYDYATIKYNPAGDTLWVRRYNGPGNGDDYAVAIAVDDSGNVYVTGYSRGTGTYDDYATIKYNPEGEEKWVKRYNGPENSADCANAIAVDDEGNVYVTGFSTGSGTGSDYATIKYNPAGDTLWVRKYNGPAGNGDDVAWAIAVDDSGNVYVTGHSRGVGTWYDYATIKYGSDGEEKWVRRYNGPENSYDEAYAIAVDDSGNVYVTGKSYAANYDYATIKYNPEGNSLWARTYNGPGNGIDVAQAIAVDDSGNVYVTGRSTGSGTGNDYATIKYNPEGDALWVRRYNGPANGSDGAQAIAVDDAGNVYVTGGSTGSGTGCDYATIKYHSAGPGVSEDLCGNVFSQIMIQPNPVRLRRIVAVRYALPKAGPVSFKLYDITGAMVKSYSNSTPTRDGILLIDAKDLSAGVYILRFNSGAIRATRKLVIEK